ncbi:MAG: hypothetical protein KGZ30_01905 [Anaplasmataceae bacterium]|nr:hypothetical protein [Anaplasmataceae bacterium]
MSVNFHPNAARVDGNYNTSVVNQARVSTALDMNSSLVSMAAPQVSMAAPQEGVVGDFFSGVWSVVTWPFRTIASLFSSVWNAIFGSAAADAKNTADAAADFAEAIKAKKFKADDFKAAYAALPEQGQKEFRRLLWVAGGHQEAREKDWPTQLIEKKKYSEDDRALFKKAYQMQEAKAQLTEFANALGEEGLKNSKEAKKECYDGKKLPEHVKAQVKALGGLLATGHIPASNAPFNTDKEHIKPYKRACEILSENDFLLVPTATARRELRAMHAHLVEIANRHGDVLPHDIATLYKGLDEKSRVVLADVVGSAAKCAGHGDEYLRGVHVKKGAQVVPDAALVTEALTSMLQFDAPRSV